MRRTHVGRESRRGEREREKKEDTVHSPVGDAHVHADERVCRKKKGRCRPSSGASRPIVHARGWVGSLLKCKPSFFSFFLFFSRGGSLVELDWRDGEGERTSLVHEREREGNEERGGSIATPDATLRFETGEKQAGWLCVGIFHPLRIRDALSSFPIVTYTQVACTVLTLFETGPFVYRYVAPSAEYWPKGSHRKRVEGCRRREGCRTPSLILHVAFLLSFFSLSHSSFFFFFSPLLPRGSRR